MSSSTSPHSLAIPSVSWDQIHSFHENHFSPLAKQSFVQFIQPQQPTTTTANDTTSSDLQHHHHQQQQQGGYRYNDEGGEMEGYDYEEGGGEGEGGNGMIGEEGVEEDLGYYPDGVKRTLTDAQIAIFRHSEIQEMLKTKRKQLLAAADETSSDIESPPPSNDIELQDSPNKPNSITEDYSTHDPRRRPIPLTEPTESSALPWDDEDVGAWEEGNQNQQQQMEERERIGGMQGVNKSSGGGNNMQRKPLAVKATYDAPSGKQFFWPAIEK